MKNKPQTKNDSRTRRHARVRAKISGTAIRPRLAIFKSNRFVSAQLIDDEAGKTLAAAHGREFSTTKAALAGIAQAKAVGESIAASAKKLGIETIVFDRGGYTYAAQVSALANAARAGGLKF